VPDLSPFVHPLATHVSRLSSLPPSARTSPEVIRPSLLDTARSIVQFAFVGDTEKPTTSPSTPPSPAKPPVPSAPKPGTSNPFLPTLRLYVQALLFFSSALVPAFSVAHPGVQRCFFASQPPPEAETPKASTPLSSTLLQALCNFPLPYFTRPTLSSFLFPLLVGCSYGNQEASQFLSSEIDPSSLCSFIERELPSARPLAPPADKTGNQQTVPPPLIPAFSPQFVPLCPSSSLPPSSSVPVPPEALPRPPLSFDSSLIITQHHLLPYLLPPSHTESLLGFYNSLLSQVSS
jgi:hypothetical protein